jgi:carbohydrate-selective porin OprB
MAPVVGAGEDKGELERLRQENKELKAAALEQDISEYLAETKGWEGAQGGDGLKGVTLHASFTSVYQGTLGQGGTSGNVSLMDGDFDLNFDMQVSEQVSLFIYMTANNGGSGSLPANFPTTGIAALSTNAGVDGIDVNGTVPTNPGAVVTNEVGLRWATKLGDTTYNSEVGEIDPRHRFLQNAICPDNNTGFIHNSFTDPASVNWITSAGGTTSLGYYAWVELGDQKQFTLSGGWFNTAGQWFNNGQLYIQIAWKGDVSGREMNLRFLVHWDGFNPTVDNDTWLVGWSWDWWLTEKIGVFFTGGFNTDDTNPVDYDFQVGFVFNGLISSRPDDQLGAGFLFTHLDDDVVGVVPEDTEFGFEVYYKLAMADGKVFVTPHFIFVVDPGGGVGGPAGFVEDSLFILGVRVHVPF